MVDPEFGSLDLNAIGTATCYVTDDMGDDAPAPVSEGGFDPGAEHNRAVTHLHLALVGL